MTGNEATRWEYRVFLPDLFSASRVDTLEQKLNEWGGEGWELAGSYAEHGATLYFLFKRPQPVAPPPLNAEEERELRNASMAQALLVLSPEKRDEVLNEVLTEDERQSAVPPPDFYERVQDFFAGRGMAPGDPAPSHRED